MIEFEFEVYCEKCGAVLAASKRFTHRNDIWVEPCKFCLEAAHNKAIEEKEDQ